MEIAPAHLTADHPEYAWLLELSDKTAAACVTADAEPLAESMLTHALSAGVSVVVERTDAASESCHRMLWAIREAGYALEVYALAASDASSLLAVHRRYERLLAACGRGPFTLHADVMGAQRSLRALLERVSAWPQPPELVVLGRSGEVLHRGAHGAAEQVRAEQDRPLTAAEKSELADGWLEVWQLKEARHAPRADLEVVRAHKQRALRQALGGSSG